MDIIVSNGLVGLSVNREATGREPDGRTVYNYCITTPEAQHIGSDLSTGRTATGEDTEEEGMSALLTFLSQAAEESAHTRRKGRGSKDSDQFPLPIMCWAGTVGPAPFLAAIERI
jgi:hypothetical protein